MNIAKQMNLVVDEEGQFLCPQCGFHCTHIDAVDVLSASGQSLRVMAGGEDEFSLVSTRTLQKKDSGRRHSLILKVSCENGCVTGVQLQQHKGVTYTTLFEMPTEENDWVVQ